jgi:hypothetical protein
MDIEGADIVVIVAVLGKIAHKEEADDSVA